MLPYNDELVVNGTLLAFEKATDYRFIHRDWHPLLEKKKKKYPIKGWVITDKWTVIPSWFVNEDELYCTYR
jgi:hypothetical protein